MEEADREMVASFTRKIFAKALAPFLQPGTTVHGR